MKAQCFIVFFFFINNVCLCQSFSELTEVAWAVNYVSGSCTGDIDGDGDDDLIVTSADPCIVWYENNLSGHFVSEHQLDLTGYILTGTTMGDLDGDSDQDLLALDNISETLVWFANDGNANLAVVSYLAEGLEGLRAPQLADVDGDGDKDILAFAIYESRIFWLENDGSGQFSSPQDIDSSAVWPHFIAAGDLDGDEILDVITSPSESTIYWQKNVGDGVFQERQLISSNVESIQRLKAIDLDGDDDLDLISLSSYDEKIAWFINDGSGNFSNEQILSEENGATDFNVVDFDIDGDADILFYTETEQAIIFLGNDGFGNFTQTETIDHDYYYYPYRLSNLHLNDDGYPDLILSCYSFTQSLINTGGTSLSSPIYVTPQLNGATDAAHGDLNGDGDDEIVFVSYNAKQILYYDSLKVGTYDNLHIAAEQLDAPNEIFVTDFEPDGDLDIGYKLTGDHTLWWIENDGTGVFTTQHQISTAILNMDFIRPCDLDNDNDLDILIRRADLSVAWVRNLGNGVFAPVNDLSGIPGCKDFVVYDLDADGDNDFVIVQEEIFSVRLNNGNQVFLSAGSYYLPTLVFTGYGIALGDIDLDTKPDVLVSSVNNQLRWYKNISNNLFETSSQTIDAVSYAGKITFADLNGDNAPDILSGFTGNGPGYWLRNNGNLTFDLFTFDLGSGTYMKTADLDGDNDLETYFVSGTRSGIYFNTIGDGCTDPNACNYNPGANTDDGSCNFYQPGDFNCDGIIGSDADIEIFLSSFGCVGNCDPFDLDGDGIVGTNDLMLFFALIGE